MYVCICSAVTDKEIRNAVKAGANDLAALQTELGVAINCGSCADDAAQLIRENRSAVQRPTPPGPRLFNPASA
jgi:bacterioferritin-associated ferredoxin